MIKVQNTFVAVCGMLMMSDPSFADGLKLQMRSQVQVIGDARKLKLHVHNETWWEKETAFIVCDVWDAHHCLNAVRRLEEFAPRMNEVLKAVRQRGVTIIHSPSDCMGAYEDHAARKRAVSAPVAKYRPPDVELWCSRESREESAVYPLDQSDGGEDDDPAEHAEWVEKLKAQGRNPSTPWKTQSPLIEIDANRDFISDRGDEIWNVLESRGIRNVILVGVHLNMCVLGRPFGLRQMVRNGKRITLMRDLTDCMYNPKRWPYVDHFTGNALMMRHVESFVCPTITSDQILGGEPFRSKFNTSSESLPPLPVRNPAMEWSPIYFLSGWAGTDAGFKEFTGGPVWYRCVVRLPKLWANEQKLRLNVSSREPARVWLNGHEAVAKPDGSKEWVPFQFAPQSIVPDDFHLLVMRVEHRPGKIGVTQAPVLNYETRQFTLQGNWQFRLGDDKSWSNIPLPAKFGGSTDMLFEPIR